MHEQLLASAALPAPTIILGLLMRPYSLGHELFLIREGNPLAVGGKVKHEDIRKAVWLCASDWDQCCAMHNSWLEPTKIRLWQRRIKDANYDLAEAALREYLDAGRLAFPLSDMPRPDRNSGGTSRMPGAPFILRLHNFLMIQLRKNESEAWNYPYGLAVMRWETHWEQEGGLDIRGPHEESFDKFVAEKEAERAAKKGVK